MTALHPSKKVTLQKQIRTYFEALRYGLPKDKALMAARIDPERYERLQQRRKFRIEEAEAIGLGVLVKFKLMTEAAKRSPAAWTALAWILERTDPSFQIKGDRADQRTLTIVVDDGQDGAGNPV
jgi:hypothetical protein